MKLINSAPRNKSVGPYSQAIDLGNLVYTSGIIGLQSDNTLALGLEQQVKEIFENTRSVLGEVGLSLSNVVKTTVYVVDLKEYGVFNKLFAKEFAGHKPARSTVQVAALPLGASIEIEFIAERQAV